MKFRSWNPDRSRTRHRGEQLVLGPTSPASSGVPIALSCMTDVASCHSPGPVVRDYRVHTRDLLTLLEERVAEPATLVGWSAGGIVALDAALARPGAVPHWFCTSRRCTRSGTRRQDCLPPSCECRCVAAFSATPQTLLGRSSGSRSTKADARTRWTDPGPPADRNRQRCRGRTCGDRRRNRRASHERCNPIRTPVMGVTGDRTSPMLRSSMRRLDQLLPAMTIRTLAGGHAAHLADRVAFAETIAAAVRPSP